MRREFLSELEDLRKEMAEHIKSLASPCVPGESVKACMRRVASKTGFSFGEIKRLWYQEVSIIPAHIADHVRKEAQAHAQHLDRQIQHLKMLQEQTYKRSCPSHNEGVNVG